MTFPPRVCYLLTRMLPAVGQNSATTFPPPLGGRDRERGRTRTASVSCSLLVRERDRPRIQCFVTTPLPVPPPPGGREPWGTDLRNSRTESQPEYVEHRGVPLLLELRRINEPGLARGARP